MKGFSRQLLLKHQHLRAITAEPGENVENITKQLDALISLEQFLNVTGVEPKSIKVGCIL